MRTEAQIAGNGAKPRGPVTTIGRAISAQDSTTDAIAAAVGLKPPRSTPKSQSSPKQGLEPQDSECQQAAAARGLGPNIASWTTMRPVGPQLRVRRRNLYQLAP